MADTKLLRLSFEKGLLESQEPSVVPPGFATALQNWIPEPGGGLRARRGWLKGSTTGAPLPATRKCVGIGYFTRLITPGIVQFSDVAQGTGDPTISLSPAWKQPTAKGSLLILVTTISNSDGTTVLPTPTGYTQAVASADTSGRPRAAIFYKANAASESGVVSVLWQGLGVSTPGAMAQLLEISNIALSSPLDQTASTNAAADATPDSGTTAATVQAVEFVVSALVDEFLEAQTSPTNGFQQLSETQIDATTDGTTGVYYKATTATGAQSVSATTATANDVAGAVATFKGWFTATPAAGQTASERFIAFQNDTTEYDALYLDRDSLAAGTWASVGSITASDPSQLLATAPGLGRTWITNTQFSTLQYFDGEAIRTTTDGPAGRCVAVHKNRVFVGGATGNPGRLFYSDLNDGNTWPAANFIDVGGRDDGEPIEDITPFEDGLLIGKRTSLYFLSGDGPNTFRLDKLNGGGAAPGRSIIATPYGAVIAGRKHVWLWAGGGVDLISRAIESSYGFTGSWMSLSYIDETVFILDQGSGTTWALHMPTGTWRTEKVGSGNDMPAVIYNQDFTQLYGPKSSTVASLLNYREFPGTARGKDFDTLSEVFSAYTDEIWAGGPETKFSPLRLFLQIRQRGGDAGDGPLTVTPVYDGVVGAPITWTPQAAAGTYRASLPVGQKAGLVSALYRLDQTLASTDGATLDIEDAELEVLITKKTP